MRRGETYDLVKHETLTVDLDRDPLDIAIYRGISDINGDHESLDRTVVERFSDSVIVEVATESAIA
jgi:hypothetical protein